MVHNLRIKSIILFGKCVHQCISIPLGLKYVAASDQIKVILEEKALFTTFITFIGIDISKEKHLNLISQIFALSYFFIT